jgi:mono/diheme cytochrome c family protein
MRRRLVTVGLPVLLIVAAAGAAWTLMAREWSSGPADPTDAAMVATGQALYQESCARCHGEDMSGELGWISKETELSPEEVNQVAKTLEDVAPAHDTSGDTQRLNDETLFAVIKDGPIRALNKPDSRMPAFSDRLNDDEIWAIVAFMKSEWLEADTAAAETN